MPKKPDIHAAAKAETQLQELRSANARLLRQLDQSKAKTEQLVDAVYRAARDAADQLDYEPVAPPKVDKRKDDPETAILLVSDWQLGKKTPTYSTEVCAKRVALYADRVRRLVDIQRADRPIKRAVVCLLGDLVEGEMIFPGQEHRIDASLFRQVMLDGPEILGALLRNLLTHFDEVVVHDVIGNHGALGGRGRKNYHPESNADAMLYQATAMSLRGEKRLEWRVNYQPGERAWHKIFAVGQHNYFMFHGDQMRGGGFAGLPYYGFARAINNWGGGVIKTPFRTGICGHWHQLASIPINDRILFINGCFPAGAPVITPAGPRPIEDLRPGEEVMSRDGTFQRVKKVWSNEATSLVYLGVKGLPKELALTPSHQVWAMKGQDAGCKFKRHDRPAMAHGESGADAPQWVPAEMLSAGDWVHAPFPTLPATIACDVSLAWVYGLYLAEGWATVDGGRSKRHSRIHFGMHVDEIDTHLARAKKTLDRVLKIEGRICAVPAKHGATLYYSGRDVAVQWKQMFGHGAHHKFVPQHFYSFTEEAKRAVVQGWIDGDGHTSKQTGVVSGATVSPQLAWGMYMLAASVGLEPFICERGKVDRKFRPNRYYEVSLTQGQNSRWVKGERFLRVCHRHHGIVAVPVYDLEVEGEHTYVVNGVGVHNSTESDNEWLREELKAQAPPGQYLLFAHDRRGVTVEHRVWLS